MPHARAALAVAATVLCLGVAIPASDPAGASSSPISLLVPSSTAFSVLGHSCGGIQEQAFATAFGADGYPAGAVYLQTKCGGSGRGGGYNSTTYSAWVTASWDFAGRLRSSARLSVAPVVSPAFAATDSRGDTLANALNAINVNPANCAVGNTTYCSYRAYLVVQAPDTPTSVRVSQVGDTLVATWTTPTTGGLPASSTVTATPTAGGVALSATVTGGATTAAISAVAPATAYSVVVTSTNLGGTSAPSAPVTITTGAASTVPGAPIGVTATWASNTSILVHWSAPTPGDSPIDDYQVSVATYDPSGTPTLFDAGNTTSLLANGFDSVPDYQVQVYAHNAAGWGAWSSRVILGGL